LQIKEVKSSPKNARRKKVTISKSSTAENFFSGSAPHDESMEIHRRESEERLRVANAELAQRLCELEHVNAEVRNSRRAAVTLMSDAVQAQEALEKSNAELRASDEFNRSLMEASADCVKVLDLEGRVLMMNTPGLCLLEIDDLTPFLGCEWPSLWPAESRPALDEAVRRARNGESASYFGFCPTAKGSPRWWDARVSPVRDSTGAIVRLLAVSRDVTERKQAEEAMHESELRFRGMADAAPVLIWVSDTTKGCTWFNKWWLEFTGRTMEQLIGNGWADDVHPDDLERCLHIYVTNFDVRRPFSMDYRLKRRDGEYRWVLDNGLPRFDPDGKFAGYIGSCVDITERRQIEEKVRETEHETKLHLETLVQERTAELQEIIAELEHFSYTITHDMRAPLRSMQGFGGLLLEDTGNHLTSNSADYLRRIVGSAHRMDALIRDSLQYARVVRESVPLDSVQPALILRGILESYPNLQPPNVHIQLIEPFPPVIANEAGLAQCFSNLLVNAAKFVKSGVTPEIRIWAETVEGKSNTSAKFVRFWFEDNGIGIPREFHERIFVMFQQLNKNYDGTGVGLALVRKTAERMGGKVGLQSEPGKGSRFWLELKSAPV
jgi:PAS domain S-box-containing protein